TSQPPSQPTSQPPSQPPSNNQAQRGRPSPSPQPVAPAHASPACSLAHVFPQLSISVPQLSSFSGPSASRRMEEAASLPPLSPALPLPASALPVTSPPIPSFVLQPATSPTLTHSSFGIMHQTTSGP